MTKDYTMETGSVSEKIGRGRHTTRHSEMFEIDKDTFVFDTPGFSSLFVPGMTKEKLEDCFPEFGEHLNNCRFVSRILLRSQSRFEGLGKAKSCR